MGLPFVVRLANPSRRRILDYARFRKRCLELYNLRVGFEPCGDPLDVVAEHPFAFDQSIVLVEELSRLHLLTRGQRGPGPPSPLPPLSRGSLSPFPPAGRSPGFPSSSTPGPGQRLPRRLCRRPCSLPSPPYHPPPL